MTTAKLLAAALVFATGAAKAETFEVRILNKGDAGPMVFEPAEYQVEKAFVG